MFVPYYLCGYSIVLQLILFFRLCKRSLLHESFIHVVIEKIPGRLNDRKTLLGELNWIYTAITDTIAWSVLPHGKARTFLMRMSISVPYTVQHCRWLWLSHW